MTQIELFKNQIRWANFLSQFHFQFAHVPGKQNLVADEGQGLMPYLLHVIMI